MNKENKNAHFTSSPIRMREREIKRFINLNRTSEDTFYGHKIQFIHDSDINEFKDQGHKIRFRHLQRKSHKIHSERLIVLI